MREKTGRAWLEWVLWLLILLAIGLAAGAERIWLSDFTAINGDFQNYNVLRRFLDGQVPYRDFANYLGMGVLWLASPFLMLRNTFTVSLFVTNALAAVLCSVTVWVVLWLATGRRRLAMALGALTPLLYRWTGAQGIFTLFTPGASMRMGRAFLPVLLVLIFLAAVRKGNRGLELFHSRRALAVIGAALGLGAVWANDFGYAAIGAGACILLVLTLFQNPRRPMQKLLTYLIFLGCTAGGFLLAVTVVTAGSPMSFFRQSAGVAEYQFWYYNFWRGGASAKYFTLWDFLTGAPEQTVQLAAAAVILIVFVILFVKKRLTCSGVALLFLELTGLFAQLIYAYGSGHYLHGFLRMVNVLIAAGAAMRAVLTLLERASRDRLPKQLPRAVLLSALAVLCLGNGYLAWRHIAPLSGEREGVYVAELDGWFTGGETLKETADLLAGERYFSTYASALETIHGVYQPTGTDYIIHALGSCQQADYLADFLAGDYPYAVTINKDYTLWEWWVQRANWYFYRELFARYTPIYSGGYALVWQKSGGAAVSSGDCTLDTTVLEDGSVRLRITLGERLADRELVADVALSYTTDRTGPALHEGVMVRDDTLWGFEGVYYLPAGEQNRHIPIIIKGGTGEVVLTASPEGKTGLGQVTALVEGLFDQEALQYAFYG